MDEDINIRVNVDNGAALISLQELETKAGQMKDKVGEMQSSLDAQMPGYAEGMTTRYTQFQDNIDRLLQLRKSIETAANSFDAEKMTSQFTQMFSTVQNVFNDFVDNFDLSKSITESLANFPEEAKGQLLASFKKIQPTLIGELRKIGLQSARTVGQQADETLIQTLTHSKAYEQMLNEIGGDRTKAAANLQKFAQLSIPYSVAQYHRNKIVGWKDESSGPRSFREMLPKAFQSISSYVQDSVIRQRGANKDESAMLSKDELESLTKIVMSNSYALDSAVKEGVARKYNGRVFVNDHATREMINAMAGRVMHDIVNGAQGEARYGIENVEDPDIFYKIARKNNKMLTGSLSTARSMNDVFEWLNPGYYNQQNVRFTSGGKKAGVITFDPRIDTRAYAEYTLQDMKNGAAFVGKPVVAEGEIVRPEDYHQITLRDSILHRRLRATSAGDNVEHNGFSQNAIYLKLPEEAFDYRTSEERLTELKKDLADRYREGYTIGGRHYSYTRSNSTHAEFVPDDIITELGGGDFNRGRATFLNGAAERYSDFVKFNKAKDYQNKTATDSQTLKDLYGTDFSGAVVVVADLEKLGMDGFNIISDKLVPASFQGRESAAAEKATYVKTNFGGLFELYKDKVDANGNLVIPGAAPGGADLVIPPNVSMIEGKANIKNYDTLYAGMNLDQINAERSKVMQRGDLSAKVTYGGAATDSRWLSHQLVQTFGHSFSDNEKAYFQQVFFDELASLGDAEAVKRKLFNGEDVDLTSNAAAQRIQDYQDMLFARQAQGDLLLPEGAMKYGMAAPWLPNIFNAAFKQAKVQLTPEQEAAAIEENNAVYMKLLADQLGIVRAPYTAEGNIKAKNEGLKNNIAQLVKLLGFDPEGLYMAPNSAIMRLMQTEDFDGDINGILGLSSKGVGKNDPEFVQAMNNLIDKAITYRQKYIDEKAGRTEEQQEAIKAAHTRKAETIEDKEYGMFNPEDNASRDIEGAKAGAKMGAASAISRNAWQYGPSVRIAKAFKDASSHYDAVSTWLKERKDWDLTKEEEGVLGGGAPFLAIAKWANDALETTENGREWTAKSQKLFNDRNIDKVNLPSMNQEDVLNAMYTRFTAKARGWDVTGNFNWDEIFANLPDVDENTSKGKMTKLLRNVKRDLMQGEYVAISTELQGEINALANAAYAEIEREVKDDKSIPIADKKKEINKRYKDAGGQVAKNISSFVLTESDINRNKDLQIELQQLQDISGGKDIYGHGYGFAYVDPNKIIEENQREIDRISQAQQERQRQINELKNDNKNNRTNKNMSDEDYARYWPEYTVEQRKEAARAYLESKKANEEEIKKEFDEIDRVYASVESGELKYDQRIMKLHSENRADEERKQNLQNVIQLASDQSAGLYDYIKAQERISSALESSRLFKSEKYSNIIKKSAKIDETPEAEAYYRQNMWKAGKINDMFMEIKESKDFQLMDQQTQDEINKIISPDKGILSETNREFGLTAELKSKNLLERFQKINKKNGGIDSQLQLRFEEYEKSIKKIEEYKEQLEKNILNPEVSEEIKDELRKNLKETEANLQQTKQEINKTKNRDQNIANESKRHNQASVEINALQQTMQAERYDAQVEQQVRQWHMRGMTDPFSRNMLQRYAMYNQFSNDANNAELQIAQAKDRMAQAKSIIDDPTRDADSIANAQKSYNAAQASLAHYTSALKTAKDAMSEFQNSHGKFSTVGNAFKASLDTIAQSLDRLLQQFGRQMFRQAFQEAKKFVVQYDTQMRNIQAITLKTDEEMASLKERTIERAIELKTSVSNVASIEADLYRQGLSDDQVEERSEAIIKFATVTGAKINDAGKAITTAIQNGLVDSAEEAMDVLVSLGDSAATTANEIFKGMQKSAAAAKIAGVSYEELTTLLTIGTSKTQLSGQVIGTGLQTIFSRMNRVTNQGYVNDETGASVTINDVEKALNSAGVQLRTADKKGFRNSFDVLRDLSEVWEDLPDMQRSNITYTMAGGRQTNIFQSLMQGMAEDNGAEIGRLLGLAEDSKGVTESKYAIAVKSITASLEELKSTYDGLVANISGDGFFVGTIDAVTGIVSGLKDLTSVAPGVGTAFTVIGAAVAAFAVKAIVAKTAVSGMAGILSTIAGLAAAGGVAALMGGIGSDFKELQDANDENKIQEKNLKLAKEYYEDQKKRLSPLQDQVDEVNKLGEAWENNGMKEGSADSKALDSSLLTLVSTLGVLGISFDENAKKIENWRKVAEAGQKAIDVRSESAATVADAEYEKLLRTNVQQLFGEYKTSATYGGSSTIKSTLNKMVLGSRDVPSYTYEIPELAYAYESPSSFKRAIEGIGKARDELKTKGNLGDTYQIADYLYENLQGEEYGSDTYKDPFNYVNAVIGLQRFLSGKEKNSEMQKIWDQFTGSLGSAYYQNWLENGGSKVNIKELDFNSAMSLLNTILDFSDSSPYKELSKEEFESSASNLTRAAITESKMLSHITQNNSSFISSLAETAAKSIDVNDYNSAEEFTNAIIEYRQGLIKKYSGKDKEWLNQIMNPDMYKRQGTYENPDTGETITIGSNDEVSSWAEIVQRHYEEGKGNTELSANTSAVGQNTGALNSLTAAITGKSPEDEQEEVEVDVELTINDGESNDNTAVPKASSGNGFAAPPGAIVVANAGVSDVVSYSGKQMKWAQQIAEIQNESDPAKALQSLLGMAQNDPEFAKYLQQFSPQFAEMIKLLDSKEETVPHNETTNNEKPITYDTTAGDNLRNELLQTEHVLNVVEGKEKESSFFEPANGVQVELDQTEEARLKKIAEAEGIITNAANFYRDNKTTNYPLVDIYNALGFDEEEKLLNAIKLITGKKELTNEEILKIINEYTEEEESSFFEPAAGVKEDIDRIEDEARRRQAEITINKARAYYKEHKKTNNPLEDMRQDLGQEEYDKLVEAMKLIYNTDDLTKDNILTAFGLKIWEPEGGFPNRPDTKGTGSSDYIVPKRDPIPGVDKPFDLFSEATGIKEPKNSIIYDTLSGIFGGNFNFKEDVIDNLANSFNEWLENITTNKVEVKPEPDYKPKDDAKPDVETKEPETRTDFWKNTWDEFIDNNTIVFHGDVKEAQDQEPNQEDENDIDIDENYFDKGEVKLGGIVGDFINGIVTKIQDEVAKANELNQEIVIPKLSDLLPAPIEPVQEEPTPQQPVQEKPTIKQDDLNNKGENGIPTGGTTKKTTDSEEEEEASFYKPSNGVTIEINQNNNSTGKTNNGIIAKHNETTKPKTTLKEVVSTAVQNAKKSDLSQQYLDFMYEVQKVSGYEQLNDLLKNNEIDASIFTTAINGDTELLKMLEDMDNGGTKYSWNDVVERLRQSALGASLKTQIPQVSTTAYSYDEQMAALNAVVNGTATDEQYSSIAKTYGIDRNRLMSNVELYTGFERDRLAIEKDSMERAAGNYVEKLMGLNSADVQKMLEQGMSFDDIWDTSVSTKNETEQKRLRFLMQSYKESGYSFSYDKSGKLIPLFNGKPFEQEDILNPYEWNRSVGRSQTRADVLAYLKNGEEPTDEKRRQALKSFSSDMQEYINLSDEARDSAEGWKLLSKIRIQVAVDGLDDLAELGEMSQEAITWAKQLATGGTLRFDAMHSIRASTYSTNQLAGVANASVRTAEMNKIIMDTLNLQSEDDFYRNEDAYLKEYRNYLNSTEFRTQLANNYKHALDNATNEEDRASIKERIRSLDGMQGYDKAKGYVVEFGQNWFSNSQYQKSNAFAKNGSTFYSPNQLRTMAQDIFNASDLEAAIKAYEDQGEEIKNKYPQLYEWMYTTDANRKKELETEIRLKFVTEGFEEVQKAGAVIENIAKIAEGMIQGGYAEQQAQALMNKDVGDTAYFAYMMQQADAVKNKKGTFTDELKQYIGQTLNYNENQLNSKSALDLVNEFMSDDRQAAVTQQRLEELSEYKTQLEEAGKTVDLDYIKNMGAYINENGQLGMYSNWWKNIAYTPNNLLKDYGQKYSAEFVETTFEGILNAYKNNEDFIITDQTLADQIRNQYGDVATVLMNRNLYNEDYVEEMYQQGRSQLALRRYKEAERRGELSSGASDLANSILYGTTSQKSETISKLISSMNDLEQFAGILNMTDEELNKEENKSLKQMLADRAGVSVDEFNEKDRLRVSNMFNTEKSQYWKLLSYLAMDTDDNDLMDLYSRFSNTDFAQAFYKRDNPFAFSNYYSESDMANAANMMISYMASGNVEELNKYYQANAGVAEAALGRYSGLKQLYNISKKEGMSKNFLKNNAQISSSIIKDIYSNDFAFGRVLQDSSNWIDGLLNVNDEEVKNTEYAMETWMEEHNKRAEAVGKTEEEVQSNQNYLDTYLKYSGAKDAADLFENFGKYQGRLNDIVARENTQITNTAAMLLSTGSNFANRWLDLNTGKGVYASKYRATNKLYTDSFIRNMNLAVLDNGLTRAQAEALYKDELNQSPELVRYLQLLEQGHTADETDMRRLEKQIRESHTNNPMVGYQRQLTSTEKLDYINQIMSAGDQGRTIFDMINDTNPEIASQLMNVQGLADYMATYGEKTEAAARAQKELGSSIRSITNGALEEQGEILSGLTQQIETIVTGNILDSVKQKNQGFADIFGMSDVISAYNRISKGTAKPEDYDMFQNAFNISDKTMEQYLLGNRSIVADYSSVITGYKDLQKDSARVIAEGILQREFGNGFDVNNISKDQKAKANASGLLNGTGYVVRGNTLYWTGEGISFDELSTVDKNAAARKKWKGDEALDYLQLFNLVNGMENFSFDDFVKQAGELGLSTDVLNNLWGTEAYRSAEAKGDVGALLNMLYQGAYGTSRYGGLNMQSTGVSGYIDALLNGDADTLRALINDETMMNYLMNIQGAQEAYNVITSGGALEQYQKDALKSGIAYQKLYEQERNGVYQEGTADLAMQLAKGTEEQQRSALNQYSSQIKQVAIARDALATMVADTDNITDTQWEALTASGKVTEEEVEYYKQHIDKLNDLAPRLKKSEEDTLKSLQAAILTAFNLDDLSHLADEGNETIKQLVQQLLDISGIKIDENNNLVSSGESRTAADIFGYVSDTGEYISSQIVRQRANSFANMIMGSTGREDLEAKINEASAENGWMRNENDVKAVLTRLGLSEDVYARMRTGNIQWDEFQQAALSNSDYGALIRNEQYNRNIGRARELFGNNFLNGEFSYNQEEIQQSRMGDEDKEFWQWFDQYEDSSEVLTTLAENSERAASAQKKLASAMLADGVRANKTYGDSSEKVADYIEQLGKDSQTANAAIKNMNSQMVSINKNTWARNNWRAGKKDNDTMSQIAQLTGMSIEQLKNKNNKSIVEQLLKASEKDDETAIEEYANAQAAMIGEHLSSQLGSINLNGTTMDIALESGTVSMNFDEVEGQVGEYLTDAQAQFIAMLQAWGLQGTLNFQKDGDSLKSWIDVTGLGKGSKGGGGGGGGGGGKSAAQKLLEKLKREQALLNHEIKMIQYQETKYENAGEIGNQNRMIELENEAQLRLIASLESAIEKTRKQMKKTKKNSDDWKSLYDSVLAYEEAIQEATQAIEDNKRKIEENEQAILKLHTDLEQEINTEIENRKQRERDMLAGTVSMQDIILEAIRQRYRDEWALIEKDIEKKREALEEQKNLIDELLQRRKDAEDEAEKYEELAEYKKQLALIEMDSTRTKDAAKLREQIAKLEKEIAWDVAEDEAEYQKEQIDDQLQAYDDFVTYGGEDLEEFLEDANNMADEVNGVLTRTQEEVIVWLKDNVKEYALAMEKAQEQMVQGWVDTYEQMIGYTHTYWEQIAEILSGKQLFLNYMIESQDYINASEDEQAQMLYNWGKMYDDWLAAQKRDAVYSHSDDDLNGLGKSSTTKKSSGSGSKDTKDDIYTLDVQDGAFVLTEEITIINEANQNGTTTQKVGNDSPKVATTATAVFNEGQYARYASGGLVDYTGPAWVDGTKTRPEAFLDAEDTALIRSFLDEAKYVNYRATVSNIDSNAFNGNSQNIGELVINITEAQFKDDADFDEVAHRVGEQFVKELSKQGFNTMSYAF